jgi:hypothetical protein
MHKNRRASWLVLVTLISWSDIVHAQLTIPEAVANGATNLVHAVPSGKAPSMATVAKDIDVVLKGVVGSSRSYLSEDQRSVLTDYEIENPVVLYHGAAARAARPGIAEKIAVTLRGGTIKIGGVEFIQFEEGLPILQPGAEHLFLLQLIDNHYYPVGLYLGAFGIVDGRLRSLSRVQNFAPEYRDVPAADAAVDVIAKIRARHNQSPQK